MLGYTLFENNTLADDSTYVVSNTIHIAQSFTPGTAHNLFTFAFKAINAASCGDATVKIYAVDANGKPTGSALASMTIANADIPTTAAGWIYKTTSALPVSNTQLIAVLSAAATGLGVRYQSVTMYSAGKAWYSPDSGTTWTAITGGGFLFQDWGQSLPSYGTYKIPLYPKGAGTYSQLFSLNSTTRPNYSKVADPLDAADDSILDSVVYALAKFGDWGPTYTDDDVFLSGLGAGVAGYLTGDLLNWFTGTAGIFGSGTSFLSQLAVNYLVKSPTKCEWYRGSLLPISTIASIESDIAATLLLMPGKQQGASSDRWSFDSAWYYTPHNTATADAGKITRNQRMCNIPEVYLPMTFMPGIWTWTYGSAVVTATGGNASLYLDASWPMQYIATGHSSNRYTDAGEHFPGVGMAYPILSVDSDNQVTLWDDFGYGSTPGIEKVFPDGECKYSYWGWQDDLSSSSTSTMFAANTKMDSYTIKSTLNKGDIYSMSVRFRAYILHSELTTGTSLTATARPFVYLNGVFSYGTERTLTATEKDAYTWDGSTGQLPTVYEFEEVISKPGGGVYTKDDLPDMEVGIVMGNLSNPRVRMAICCSQLCLIADVANLPSYIVAQSTSGLDDLGFIVFPNDRFSEFNQYVGEDGVNTLGWKVHYSMNMFGVWVSRPFKKMRSTGIRLVRRTGSVLKLRRR